MIKACERVVRGVADHVSDRDPQSDDDKRRDEQYTFKYEWIFKFTNYEECVDS